MMCSKCEERVEKAIKNLGSLEVKADHKLGQVTVKGDFDLEKVKEAIDNTGFEVK